MHSSCCCSSSKHVVPPEAIVVVCIATIVELFHFDRFGLHRDVVLLGVMFVFVTTGNKQCHYRQHCPDLVSQFSHLLGSWVGALKSEG